MCHYFSALLSVLVLSLLCAAKIFKFEGVDMRKAEWLEDSSGRSHGLAKESWFDVVRLMGYVLVFVSNKCF
jgi:hypothetical protein